ncbi:MAG: acyl-CoA synthetase FdrA, partial [Chloroflexi bacterium]|nr:acyl-CoA synthetase FdrA [Chloroflexota bacterium]NOH13402.1 acyl-CoA synthetase FdrA [Chloroflexota bacterium]
AIINGIGLGFANRVRRGPIGVVGASGTGTQAITVDVHNLGSGISHAIGTGGRDLKSDVGAITAHQALEYLKADEETKVIVLVSKPPSLDVATKLLAAAQDSDKPVVVSFIGFPPPAEKLGNLHFARTLSEAAVLAVELTNKAEDKKKARSSGKGYLRGLFSGGTLAYEALLSLQAVLSPIYSNVPFTKEQEMEDPLTSVAHTIIDLGEDIFTVGRLHPMMDNDLRIRRLRQEAEDQETGLILLDIVLGEGSHTDPASELAPVITEIKSEHSDLEVVALVVGTDEDPQDTDAQIEQLTKAGATIFRNTTEAAIYISDYFAIAETEGHPSVSADGFTGQFAAINVGLASFYESLAEQAAQTVHVDWKPPASGNQELADILAKMKG